jgi:CRISP-associated protein Cas1
MEAPTETPAGHQAALELVPARMLNEFIYCPRLFYLEWVQGEFADSVDTVDGRYRHSRVDQDHGDLADPTESPDETTTIHARSVHLTSEALGLTARLDLVEQEGGEVAPVDYKRGKTPAIAGRAWETDQIQLCA